MKYFIFLFFVVFCLACQTSYYSRHWFVEREYNPVKRGKVEMVIREKSLPVAKSKAVSHKEAYDQGMEEAGRSIQHFCGGAYTLQKISAKRDRIGILFDTSVIHSSYLGSPFIGGRLHSSAITGAAPVYRHYTVISFQCNKDL